MTGHALKELETLNTYLMDVKNKIETLKEELDDTKSYSLNLRKARVTREIVEELEALLIEVQRARESVACDSMEEAQLSESSESNADIERVGHRKSDKIQLSRECVHEESRRKNQLNPKNRRKFAYRAKKTNKLKKILAMNTPKAYSNYCSKQFILRGNQMKKNYLHHICVIGLAGTLFACGGGGGGGAPAAGGGSTSTSTSGGGAGTTTSGGGTTTSGGGTTTSGGGTPKPEPTTPVGETTTNETFAQKLAAQDTAKPLGFTTTLSGFQSGRTDRNNPTLVVNSRVDDQKAMVSIIPNSSDGFDVTVTIGNQSTTYSSTATNSSASLYTQRGNSSTAFASAVLDRSLADSFNGTDAQEFQFLRRFNIADNRSIFTRRFGVIGLQTSATDIPTVGTEVKYNGSLNGQYTVGTGFADFVRDANFTVNFATKAITGTFATPTAGNIGSNTLTANGNITGNGFTLNNLSATEGTAGTFSGVSINGNFYGNTAQELGGTVNYLETVSGSTRAVGGTFGATRQ